MRRIDRFDEYMRYAQLNDNKVTNELSLSVGTIGKSRKDGRDLSDKVIELILNHYTNLNKVWLLTGEGDMLKGEEQTGQDGIPLIPNEAFAGYGAYQYSDVPTEEVYQIREFRHASFLLRVSGDSMSPKYHSGDLVACQKIEEVTFWQWHRIYAISTKNQGILLKRIEKGDTPESVTCVSENPAYTPFELNNQEIVSVALVLGGVVME